MRLLTVAALLASLTMSGEAPRYSVRGNVDPEAMVTYLYKVPEKVRKKVNRFGAEIIFLEKLTSVQLPRTDSILLMAAGAIYNPDLKTAFVLKNNEDCSQMYEMAVPQLHEYGHMVDHTFGYLSDRKPFIEIENAGSEMFAEDFARFYCGTITKEGLKKTNPASFRYFERFDKKHR